VGSQVAELAVGDKPVESSSLADNRAADKFAEGRLAADNPAVHSRAVGETLVPRRELADIRWAEQPGDTRDSSAVPVVAA
jgi:hypothetical protein